MASTLTTTSPADANAAAAKATIDLLRVADMDDATQDASVTAVDACGRLASTRCPIPACQKVCGTPDGVKEHVLADHPENNFLKCSSRFLLSCPASLEALPQIPCRSSFFRGKKN